jgi:hypothetical protein
MLFTYMAKDAYSYELFAIKLFKIAKNNQLC